MMIVLIKDFIIFIQKIIICARRRSLDLCMVSIASVFVCYLIFLFLMMSYSISSFL
jgi:hypothetical protein